MDDKYIKMDDFEDVLITVVHLNQGGVKATTKKLAELLGHPVGTISGRTAACVRKGWLTSGRETGYHSTGRGPATE